MITRIYLPPYVRANLESLKAMTGRDDLVFPLVQYIEQLTAENSSLKKELGDAKTEIHKNPWNRLKKWMDEIL